MKLCRSPKNQQCAVEPDAGPAEIPLPVGHIGAGWPALGLDDFGILGTHRLPLDWIGGGDVSETAPELFPY
jgi:hypothetical protein